MTFVFCLVWAEVNIRPAAIGFQHNDDEAKYSPAMASKTRRFEILLVITIIINVYVIVFVLNTQKSDVDIELKSKVELLRSLSELKHALRINQSSLVVNSQFSEETTVSEVKERHIGIEGKWASFHENEWKAVNTTESRHANTALQDYCPEGGENLEGQKAVNVKRIQESLHLVDALSVDNGGNVKFGGWWTPENCKPRSKVAILIPFRKRETQLQMFLYHMHPILQRQLLAYRIFVIEQAGDASWNKGAIYNIGFKTVLKVDNFDCFIFHDVDLLLENDKNFYGCSFTPAHLSVAVDTLKYKLLYSGLFGGVQAFSKEEYITINGYSNMYWGWGGEDDDLYTRVVEKKYKVHRPPMEIGRYTMNQLDHFRSDGRNAKNVKMYRDVKARVKLIGASGLNKVNSLRYDYRVQEEVLLTRIIVNLQRYRELKV